MRKKDVKRLFRLSPGFESWLLKDGMRAIEVRIDPEKTRNFYKQWKQETRKGLFSLENITEKSKRANDVLSNVHTLMEKIVEQNNKKPK